MQEFTVQTATTEFARIIKEIRASEPEAKQYQRLKELIGQLDKITPQLITYRSAAVGLANAQGLGNNGSAEFLSEMSMYNLYQQIQQIALELRKMLPNLTASDKYDSIKYSFYYQNRIYYMDELRPEWLAAREKGRSGLQVNLKKAAEDMDKELAGIANTISGTIKLHILNMFEIHYKKFYAGIEGMYEQQNKHQIGGKGSRINRGHVAEAHERHLQEEHNEIYRYATRSYSVNKLSRQEIQEAHHFSSIFARTNQVKYFSQHEDVEHMWQHIRDSLGYQRSTVAGDVYERQVKQVKEGASNSWLRLTSYNNLKLGLTFFKEIFNLDIPAETVALKLALYMSDMFEEDRELQKIVNYKVLPRIYTNKKNLEELLIENGLSLEQVLNVKLKI